MKAKVIPTAFLLGILSVCAAYYFSGEVLMCIPVFTVVTALVLKFIFKRKTGVFLLCMLWIFIMTLHTINAMGNFKSVLTYFADDTCVVYGKITSARSVNEFYDSYVIEVDAVAEVSGEKWDTNEKCELLVRNERADLELLYGDYVSAEVFVSENESRNSRENNYSIADKADGIFYTLMADGADIEISDTFHGISCIEDASYMVKNYIEEVSFDRLSERNAAFLMGLLVSDKEHLDDEAYEALENSGLLHMSVASGFHVEAVVTAVVLLLGLLAVNRKRAMLISVPIIIFYIFINGCSVSIIRAAIVMFMIILAAYAQRDFDSVIGLCMAGLVIILLNPLNVFNISFILSFCSVGAIIFFVGGLIKLFDKIHVGKGEEKLIMKHPLRRVFYYIRSTLCVCIAVQLVIVPISAHFFGYVAPYSIIANLYTSWLIPIIMFFGALMLIFCMNEILCAACAFAADKLINLFFALVQRVSEIPGARIEAYISFGGVVLALMILSCAYFYFKKKPKTACAIGVICILIIGAGAVNKANEANKIEINFVNVGQGDGAFIKYGNGRAIVIDGGDVGESDYTFSPYMKRSGVKSIECIFVSHFDDDHAKNILNVMDNFEVRNVALPIRMRKSEMQVLIENKAREINADILYVRSGDEFEISDDINVKVYMPTVYTSSLLEENEASMAIKVEAADKSILFLGDLPTELQDSMAAKYRDELECDILKAAHHGAKNGYSSELMRFAMPKYIVVSCGDTNIYHHPDPEVIRNFNRAGAKTFITNERGDVSFLVDTRGGRYMRIKCNNEIG